MFSNFNVCRFSRDRVVKCSERTVFCLAFHQFFTLVYVEYAIVKFANMNKLVQNKTKLYFQGIKHKMFRAVLMMPCNVYGCIFPWSTI